MRHFLLIVNGILAALVLCFFAGTDIYAAPGQNIETGIFADEIDLSGMSEGEAMSTLQSVCEGRQQAVVTLTDDKGFSKSFPVGDIGYRWANESIVREAVSYGKSGDIVSRYMQLKDLTRSPKVYNIDYAIDTAALGRIVSEMAGEYDREAINATMTRSEDGFVITDGQTGRAIDQSAVVDGVVDCLLSGWDGSDLTYTLDTQIVEPLGSYEDLSMVKDVLGTFTTSYSTSGSSRSANIANACSLINGTLLYPGEEFSTLDTITPFSEANGYFMAGSYLNGKVVDSLGGGICQVSTTLYNAVLLSELEVTERHNHSMIISYVKPSMDAAIAESSGKNFRFINSTEYPIYIDGHTTSEKKITFTVYGVEYRSPSHSVSYESEVLETDAPEADAVYADEGAPAGYSSGIQSAHVGYKAKLWKNTYENGTLEKREEVNSSKYNKSPRSITIGVATDNPDVRNMLMEAVASGSADAAAAAAASAAAILSPPQPAPEAIEAAEVAQ